MWTSAGHFSLKGDGQEMGIATVYVYMLNCIVSQTAKDFSMFFTGLGKENDVCGR